MEGLYAPQDNFGALMVNNREFFIAPSFLGSFTNHGILDVENFGKLTVTGTFINAPDGTMVRKRNTGRRRPDRTAPAP
ncbi:MAG: hypothetical protein U0575_15205 [Phycisphaerales bacterium]|jgi:predicted deacetylase